jgi:eukaryotic-like serine/threonine-protein kinase
MSIKVQCPQCQYVAAAPEGHAGRSVRCKRCNTKFPLPHGMPTLPQSPVVIDYVPTLPQSPVIIDRYQVRELLGSGSFGSVYRAFDPRLGREVALKVLRTEMTASPQAVERFLREAKAAAKLDHPHIVPVHDAGRAGDVYFIASAFIKGGTLASSIPKVGMEPRRAAELAAQLASALGYAHRQGVVHRDVKPANILLDEQGSLRLMDFGLAGWTREECTRLTQQGAIMGTPAYMAPEQALGDTAQVGPASDQYSAGVVLYELLTGRRPFGGDNAASIMYQIIHTTAPPPSARRPGLDAGLDAICLRAMAKKPADRFGDGEAMAAALRAWAPTAIRMAEPLATKAPAGPPASVFEWDKETADYRSGRPNMKPSATLPIGGNPGRLSTVMASRFGPNWKLWACAFLVILLAVASAATVVCLFPPRTGAGSLPAERPKPDPAPPREELQDEIVNSFDMRLKLIKPGTFLMGSPKGEAGQSDDEQPQHSVEITRPFYLGVYPVTQAEYVQVTSQKNPSWFSKEGRGKSAVEGLDTSRFPVESVSWDEAAAFCEALNRLEAKKPAGWKYALPTEAEWEYACRAGSKTTYFFGGDAENLGNYAWYNGNSESRTHAVGTSSESRTHAVGTRMANPWGLYDMGGNVRQWCADWYAKDYYASSPNKDPQYLINDSAQARVLRGGSWAYGAEYCRAAFRSGIAPGSRISDFGLRVCFRLD